MGKRKQRNPTLHAGAVESRKGYASLSERYDSQADGIDDVAQETGERAPIKKSRSDGAKLRAWTMQTGHLVVAMPGD